MTKERRKNYRDNASGLKMREAFKKIWPVTLGSRRSSAKQTTPEDVSYGTQKGHRREEQVHKYLLLAGILFLFIFCVAPFFWMIIVSFARSPDFLIKSDFSFTFKNYIDIFKVKNLHFPDYLKNSLVISIIVAFFSALIASIAAYAIAKIKFAGKVFIILGVLSLSMFPQISIVGYLFKFMTHIGWINTYNALIFPYIAWSLPLALWMLLSYFSQLPSVLDEAALVDGASRFQIITKITLPLALPGFLSTVLLLFMYSFNEFLFALMLTVDYRARTVPVGIALFQGLHGEIPWGYIMAASIVSSVPVIMLALFFQRYIIQGLTKGAVKG